MCELSIVASPKERLTRCTLNDVLHQLGFYFFFYLLKSDIFNFVYICWSFGNKTEFYHFSQWRPKLLLIWLTFHVDHPQVVLPHSSVPSINVWPFFFWLEGNDCYYDRYRGQAATLKTCPIWSYFVMFVAIAITAGSLHFGQILAHNSILHASLHEETCVGMWGDRSSRSKFLRVQVASFPWPSMISLLGQLCALFAFTCWPELCKNLLSN